MKNDTAVVNGSFGGVMFIFGALIVMWLSGCGISGNLGIHPITHSQSEQKYEPSKVRCLWGNCNGYEEPRGS